MRLSVTAVTKPRIAGALATVACVVAVGACGTSASTAGAGSATAVLQQSVTGSHPVQSGVLNATLTVTPTGGASFLSGPLTLTVDGPFQLGSAGAPPALDLTATVKALGQSGSLGVVSNGSTADLTLNGDAYATPAGALAELKAAMTHARRRAARRGARRLPATLGLDPLSWLVNPAIVGNDVTVGGAETTQVHAGVDLPAMVTQTLAALRAHAPAVGHGASKLPASIPASDLAQLRNVHPTIDVYSGNADHTLRKFALDVSVPISGQLSKELGGVTGAQITLSVEIDQLNAPQTITLPTTVAPFSAFLTKLHSILSGLGSMFGVNLGGGASKSWIVSAGSSTSQRTNSAGASKSSSSAVLRYSRCIAHAGQDVTKLERCTTLLHAHR